MAVRTAYVPVAGAVLTAVNLAKLAGGWIGHAEVTATQTGITTAVDVTGLTVSVTAGTNRLLLVSAFVPLTQNTSGAVVTCLLMEGATQLSGNQRTLVTGGVDAMTPSVILTPSSGAHTYKVQLATSAGTVSTSVSATNPAYILVQDLGPSS